MIKFGSGPVTAQGAIDTISLGPFGEEPFLKSEHQYFYEVVSAQMPILKLATFNAIVGIAPPNRPETAGHSPMLTSFCTTHFSACLGKPKGSVGYTIWNDHALQGDPRFSFKTIPVTGTKTWGFKMEPVRLQVGYAGNGIEIGCRPSCGVILDTGTSLIGVPHQIYKTVFENVRAMKTCDLSVLPDLVFTMAGEEFRLAPDTYIGMTTGSSFAQHMNMPSMHINGSMARPEISSIYSNSTPSLFET